MNPTELVDQVIADPASASRLLRAHAGTAGVSEAFMGRVLRLFAADHGALMRLPTVARLVARHGDDRALGHRSVAVVERVRGRWPESAEAFLAAGAAATTPRDRLSYKTGAIDALARSGRLDEATALGQELVDGLHAIGEPALASRASLNLGYALMQQDRYEEAWQALDGLAPKLAEAGYMMEAASSQLALSTSLLFGGDVARAKAEALSAADAASAEEMTLLADIAFGNAAYADLILGHADLAVVELLRLKNRHEDSPVERARTLEYLGDAYSAMNLWIEAADAYREALTMGGAAGSLPQAHLRLGLGQVLLASGRYSEAITELSAAAQRYRRIGNLAWLAAAETDRAIADGALNRSTAKRLESAVSVARVAKSPFHLCRALLVSAEHGGAESHLNEAASIVQKERYARLEWRVEAERARRSEEGARLRHYRRMFLAILNEQARISSFAGRVGYLRDKARALREYLDALLAKPTSARVREAVEVVARSRAVALLDELLQARQPDLPEVTKERLESLRAILNSQSNETPTQPGSRRHGSDSSELDRAQRRWLEETHSLTEGLGQATTVAPGTVILLESDNGFRALWPEAGRASRPMPSSFAVVALSEPLPAPGRGLGEDFRHRPASAMEDKTGLNPVLERENGWHWASRPCPDMAGMALQRPEPGKKRSLSEVIDVRDIESRLRWLSYELLAPMADPAANGRQAIEDLRKLGEQILRPLLAEKGTIGVCPDGVLWRLPWLACLDAIGEVRDLEIRIHPGLSGREPDLTGRRPMLWVAEHADLPWAKTEADRFCQRFPDAQVCRSAAEVRECMSDARASFLHVVSHASYRSGHPMFSSLDFVDGPVLAAEIARSGLRIEMVTLSGCDTGRLSDVNRLEPDGLVRAFLACGAGYVVGSAWPLDDEAAGRLYDAFYESLQMGATVHEGLRSARRNVQGWKGHPYYWASPLLYGGYRI